MPVEINQPKPTEGKPETYECANCGGTFEKGWSDEEAAQELDIQFQGVEPEDCDVVCDDCYRKLLVLLTEAK